MIIKVKFCNDCPMCNVDFEFGRSCNAPGEVGDIDYPKQLPINCPLRSTLITIMPDEGSLDSLDQEQNQSNFMQVIDQTPEEEFAMYMQLSKEELISMLLENQRLLKAFKGEPSYVTEVITTSTTRPYGCWNCGTKGCGNYGANIDVVCTQWQMEQ